MREKPFSPLSDTPDIYLGFLGRLRAGWNRFWFSAADPVALHAVRVLAGLLFLYWLLPMAGYVDSLFSLQGWVDREFFLETSRDMPYSNWSLLYLFGDNSFLINGFFWFSIGVVALLTLGVATRLTSVLSYLCIVSFMSSPATRLDADILIGILAFYVMVGYVFLGQLGPQTIWNRILGSTDTFLFKAWLGKPSAAPQASYAAHFALRGLQVHFALIMLASALHKLQIGDWWAGVAFWYPLHPPFETTHTLLRAKLGSLQLTLIVMSVATYVLLAWQFSFPFWAWRPGCRWFLVGSVLVGWAAAALVYDTSYFGPFYAICALSFLQPSDWRSLAAKIQGEKAGTGRSQARKESPVLTVSGT